MPSKLLCLLLALSALACGQRRGFNRVAPESASLPRNDAEKRILDTISAAVSAGELHANVPASDGLLLRILTSSANAKTVVEIGTSTGISGLWFALALQETGGRLLTFELDERRAATARTHFGRAGVTSLVSLTLGDAHQNIRKLKAPIDVVFIDAEKEGYLDYLQSLLPLVRPGGLILAHNSDMVPDYLKAVQSNSALETVIYTSGGGLAVTLKKR